MTEVNNRNGEREIRIPNAEDIEEFLKLFLNKEYNFENENCTRLSLGRKKLRLEELKEMFM